MKTILATHIVGCLDPRFGGPAYSVKTLAEHLSARGVQADVLTFNYPFRDRRCNLKNGSRHLIAPDFFLSRYLAGWNPLTIKPLKKAAGVASIVHVHGLWTWFGKYARIAAVQQKRPLIISPRGMLEGWALRNSTFKKKVALFLYEKSNLQSATLFHATSAQELESMRQFGLTQPVALIPNGIDLPDLHRRNSIDVFQKFKLPAGKRLFLFLSRIHPKKGIEMLLREWGALSKQHQEWHLIIAGDGERAYLAKLQKMARGYELQDRVSWTGLVSGADKEAFFRKAEFFVLPSYSENFGISIAEALAHGVPVIATRETPWKEIEDFKCGWWIKAENEGLNQSLRHIFKLSANELQAMGQMGINLVSERFSWGNISQKMADTYRWILNKNNKPDYVIID